MSYVEIEIDGDEVLSQLSFEYVLEYFESDFDEYIRDNASNMDSVVESVLEDLDEGQIESMAQDCEFYSDMQQRIDELENELEELKNLEKQLED